MKPEAIERLAADAREGLATLRFESARRVGPILCLQFGGRGTRRYLVVLLGSPGPFAMIREDDPIAGLDAPRRFRPARGTRISGVQREPGDRVLRVDLGGPTQSAGGSATGEVTQTPTAGGRMFRIRLFGSAGGVSLERDGAIVEHVGRAPDAPRRHDASAAPDVPPDVPPVGGLTSANSTAGATSIGEPKPPGTSADAPGADRPTRPRDAEEGAKAPGDEALQADARRLLEQAWARIVDGAARPLRKRLTTLERLESRLVDELAEAVDHARGREIAESLAAYQTHVPAGTSRVAVPDLYRGGTVDVTLDPAVPVHIEVERRFRRIARLKRRIEHARRHLAQTRDHAGLIRESLRLAAPSPDLPNDGNRVAAIVREFASVAGKLGIRELPRRGSGRSSARAGAGPTPRRFQLEDGWFAIAGRSHHENDEITFHVAAPGDYWFHAQGVPGAHVILKSPGTTSRPPRRVLEGAASIAAHFSRARHSALVPVIYTERRYVRKFRGAAPGQVRCERETLLVVPPQLPATPDAFGQSGAPDPSNDPESL